MNLTYKAQTWYMAFLFSAILAVSQALSPFPYVAALVLLINPREIGDLRLRMGNAALAVVCLCGVIATSWTMNVETMIRLASPCILLAFIGGLDHGARASYAFEWAGRFVVGSLALSMVGFFYALAGGPPLYSLTNPDGREAFLFLTTLSNSVFPSTGGNIIRPSFIFDEPGAYAFVIDTVLLCRYLLHDRMKRTDWIILTTGFITFSLAHLIVAYLILIGERKTIRLAFIAILVLLVDLYLYARSSVSLIIDRLTFAEGTFVGDNRSELLQNAWAMVTENFWGAGLGCEWNVQTCIDRFGPFGENPLFPAALFGVVSSFLYYSLLAGVAISALGNPRRRHICVVLACMTLWSQRPFLFSLGYNILMIITFCLVMTRWRSNIHFSHGTSRFDDSLTWQKLSPTRI